MQYLGQIPLQAGEIVSVTDPSDGSTKKVGIPAFTIASASGASQPAGTSSDPTYTQITGRAVVGSSTSYTNNQVAPISTDDQGQLRVVPSGQNAGISDGLASQVILQPGRTNTGQFYFNATVSFVYDGTTARYQRGDAAGTYTVTSPGTAAANAITPVVASAVTSLVGKASAGNAYGGTMVAGATAGFFILYNATAAPSGGGALTAASILACVSVAANASAAIGEFAIPTRCSTGAVWLFSTSTTTYTVPANAALTMTSRVV